MEYTIAKLLHDFERGHMTRRQLIQALALAATTATAASAAVAAPAGGPRPDGGVGPIAGMRPVAGVADEPRGFTAIAVNHISYQVKDYAKTRDFYASLLGMKVTQDSGRQCYLTFGDHGTWLLPRNARDASQPPKVDHIAYTIKNWDKDKVEAELRRRGLEPRVDTENSFHVKDPDGYDVQISGEGMKP